MMLLRKSAALVLALLCALPVLSGCHRNDPDHLTIAEEDMPYGATMRENKSAFAVPMSYDRRFFTEEEVAKVADLFAAIQNQDSELYANTTFSFYEKYQREQVYQLDSSEALMEKLHSFIENGSADDFHFSMVMIDALDTNPDAGELKEVVSMLGNAYDGDGNFMDTVQKCYDLTVEWTILYNKDADSSVVTEQHVFLFQTENGLFALM